MKIATLVIPIVLCVLFIILPIFELVAFTNDLEFFLYAEPAIVIIESILALGSAIALFVMRQKLDWIGKLFVILLLPITLCNAFCFVDSEWDKSIFISLIMIVSVLAVYLFFVPDSVPKALSAIVSVLLAVGILTCYIIFDVFIPKAFPHDVQKEIKSTKGTYIAEVLISKDNPLEGEKTVIEVRMVEPKTGAVLGRYDYKPMEIYKGESYEIETLVIEWKDDSTLLIAGKEYPVKFE